MGWGNARSRAIAVALVVMASSAAMPASVAVVHGEPAAPGQAPYAVAILDRAAMEREGPFKAQFCGGALTTPTTVVTAAHCALTPGSGTVVDPGSILVGIGRVLREDDLRTVRVARIDVHPQYRIDGGEHDVAVLTLAEPVIGVPTLPVLTGSDRSALTKSGAAAIVAGWGNTSETGSAYPVALTIGEVVVFPSTACGGGDPYAVGQVIFDGYTRRDANPATMLCAAGVTAANEIVDSCQGDSGSPLIVGQGDSARLAGVVSWGQDCASPHPGVYTRLSAMQAFLERTGALASTVPGEPSVTVAPLDGALRVTFAPTSGSATTFVATGTDAGGTASTCATLPSRTIVPATCAIDGLPNGAPVNVTAVAVNAVGTSPVSAPVSATPVPLPDPGRIVRLRDLGNGKARATVTADATQRALACATADGRATLSAVVKPGATSVVLRRVKDRDYVCELRVPGEGGTAVSAPRLLASRG